MKVHHFFDQATATHTYIVADDATQKCAIIDSVLDYDAAAGRTDTRSADTLIDFVNTHDLTVEWILETHVHADHLTASAYLKEQLGGKIAIGEHIKDVLTYWVPLFDISHDTPMDARQFDHLFTDNETFYIGELPVKVIDTPGHTPACVSYLIDDAIFVGDVILMPYVGTARTDFPGGSAKIQYQSIEKIYALPDETRIFTCHDYPPEGQTPGYVSTVAEQKRTNAMMTANISEADYVKARNTRDENKPVPKLLLPSLQINMRAGALGEAAENGIHYLKIPLNKI